MTVARRYNKAGTPTTREVAEAVERMRDALFRAYGVNYAFSVLGNGSVIAASYHPDTIVHAVVREPVATGLDDAFHSSQGIPIVSRFATGECARCGNRHELEAFRVGARVRVVRDPVDDAIPTWQYPDREYLAARDKVGHVRSWTCYGIPHSVSVRVALDEGEPLNLYPCQLEHE